MGFLPFSSKQEVAPFIPPEQIAHTSRCIFYPDAPQKLRKRPLLNPQFNHPNKIDKDGKEIPFSYVSYKEKLPFCCRKSEAQNYKNHHEDMIPIICERFHHEKRIPPLPNCQFLLPKHATVGQLQALIKRNLGDFAGMAVYLLIANEFLPCLTENLSQLYRDHRDQDGFLYISYSSEDSYG
uniref:Autophagy-related protein n=1 Tax=Panagrellus redivivus TaxID=6233 RepID=A0A7E4UW56_PANRE